MKVYENDLEQEKVIKKWWQKNKKQALTLLTLAILIISAHGLIKSHNKQKAATQVGMYYNIMNNIKQKNTKPALADYQQIKESYSSSIYTSLSGFNIVKYYVDIQDYDRAIDELQWLVKNANNEFKSLANIRLARIYLQLNNPEKSLQILDNVKNDFFIAEHSMIKGDSYKKLAKPQQALTAYKLSLDSIDKKQQYEMWQLVNYKLNSVNIVEK